MREAEWMATMRHTGARSSRSMSIHCVVMCGADGHKTPRRAGSRGKTSDGQRLHFSKKGGPPVEGFFSQVMHNAAFLSIMDHF